MLPRIPVSCPRLASTRSHTFKAFYAVRLFSSVRAPYRIDRLAQTIRSLRQAPPDPEDIPPSDNVSVNFLQSLFVQSLAQLTSGLHRFHPPREPLVARHAVLSRLVWPASQTCFGPVGRSRTRTF